MNEFDGYCKPAESADRVGGAAGADGPPTLRIYRSEKNAIISAFASSAAS